MYFSHRRAVLENRHPLKRENSYFGRYMKAHPTHLKYIRLGAQLAIRECRRLFKHNRWNCQTEEKHIAKPFGRIVEIGREFLNMKHIFTDWHMFPCCRVDTVIWFCNFDVLVEVTWSVSQVNLDFFWFLCEFWQILLYFNQYLASDLKSTISRV